MDILDFRIFIDMESVNEFHLHLEYGLNKPHRRRSYLENVKKGIDGTIGNNASQSGLSQNPAVL